VPVSAGFLQHVVDQLSASLPVTSRRMFGGARLYAHGLFFGLIHDDVLYLKVNEATRGRYEAAGQRAFDPSVVKPGTKPMGYFSVPEEVVEDPEVLGQWAEEALAVAGAAKR